jgi:hypothetical protein
MESPGLGIRRRTRVVPIAAALLWALVVALCARYLTEHWELLLQNTPDALVWPVPEGQLPRGGAAPWVIVTAAAAAGVALARRLGRRPRLLTWGLGALTALILPAQVLGTAGLFSGRALFVPWAWAGGVCLVAAALLRRGAPADRARPAEVDVQVGRREPLLPWLVGIALLVAALEGHAIGRTLRSGPRCWDGEVYHLPVPLQWLGTSSLTDVLVRLVPNGKDDLHLYANPGNGHLLMCVPLLLGWDFLAYLVQLPFLPLAAWSCYALARAAGATRGAAALSLLALVSAPIVVEQASVPLLDLATAALSLAALALLLPASDADSVSARRAGLAGLAAGLALGTKTTALAHLGLLGVLVATSRWAWKGPRRARAATLARLAGMILVPSAFWYLRSAVLMGNPIYPIGVSLGDHVLLAGMTAEDMSGDWDVGWLGMKSWWEWPVVPLRDPIYFSEAGFGMLLVAVGGLGLVGGAVVLLHALRERRLTPMARLALMTVAGLAIFFLVAARTPRFNLPLFALFAALGGPAIDGLGAGWRRHAVGLLGTAATAVTLTLAVHYHGWSMAPIWSRAERLQKDYPAVPLAVDAMSPLVLFNDTHDDANARPATYWLTGSDHRHTVFEQASLGTDDATTFVARLRAIGANAVFLRTRKGHPAPARYDTPAFQPVARYEGEEFRSVIYLIRAAGPGASAAARDPR